MYGIGAIRAVNRAFRNIDRATRVRRRQRRKRIGPERPCGPKLVRGRGWKRRRKPQASVAKFLVYLCIAAGVFWLVAQAARMMLANSGV